MSWTIVDILIAVGAGFLAGTLSYMDWSTRKLKKAIIDSIDRRAFASTVPAMDLWELHIEEHSDRWDRMLDTLGGIGEASRLHARDLIANEGEPEEPEPKLGIGRL